MNKQAILKEVQKYLVKGDLAILNDLGDRLKEDIRDEANKLNGKAQLARSMKAILKEKDIREDLKKAWKEDFRVVVCDGYRLIATGEEVQLPMNDKAPLKGENLWGSFYHIYHEEVLVPTAGQVKALLDIKKALGQHPLYEFKRKDGQSIWVDAKYLLTMVQAMPDARVYLDRDSRISPVFFNSPEDLTFGLVLPVRVSK